MSESVGQILAIILPMGALVLSLHFLQWRQSVAMENRLRRDIRDSEERLRGEARELEERLTGEIKAVEERLTVEIRAVEERLTRRIERTDDKVDALTGEVGLVKGAVLGISVEIPSRESAPTN